MKISRPPHPASPGSAAKAPGVVGTRGKGFAAKLDQAERALGARGEPHQPAAVRGAGTVSDIGADLKAGKITAKAAIDRVVERVLDRQLGKKAGVALRQKVGAALRESLADDPLLAAKVRSLGQE
jgi:hypothetical protein